MSDRRYAQEAEARFGVPASTLLGLIQVESDGNANAVSSAGAFGKTQFIPSTAARYGVKRGSSPDAVRSQIFGAAHYLHDLGYRKNPRLALKSYNAGPGNPGAAGNYDSKVLGAARQYKGSDGSRSSSGGSTSGGSSSQVTTPGQAPISQSAGTGLADMLAARLQGPAPVASAGLPDPVFSARNSLHVASGAPTVSSGPPVPRLSVADQVAEVRRMQTAPVPQAQGSTTTSTTTGGSTSGGGSTRRGKVTVAANADRPGVSIHAGVISFVEKVAGIVGRPLTIGTGTRHNRMTVNGNVSAHWDGHAADVPLTGRSLIEAGQAALIAAGADPKWARKQTGGLYNQGHWQIIFNTHVGGDHTNHLHAGYRG